MFMPVKFKKLAKTYRKKSFTLLDVGCGDHSPSLTKKYFPLVIYHGLDKEDYNLNQVDQKCIDVLHRVDLDHDPLEAIPNAFFDVMIMNHVIEHLKYPEKVLETLCQKLKPGGLFYLECPSFRSLGLPQMKGTLQFCDDRTHIYLPNPYDLVNTLLKQKIVVKDAKVRRDPIRLIFSPFFLIKNLIHKAVGQPPRSRGLWDLYGFAFYIFGRKEE